MVKTLKFYKELTGEWFIDLPEYPGPKEDLQMVMGADTMLDYLAQGKDEVTAQVSTKYQKVYDIHLVLSSVDISGATYRASSKYKEISVWLCDVTKFVFDNKFPFKFYIKKI